MHTHSNVTATEHAQTDRGMDKVGGGGPSSRDGGHWDLVALDGLRRRLNVLYRREGIITGAYSPRVGGLLV